MSEDSIFDLSPAEKLQLVEDIWDDLAATPSEVPIHDWQKEELAGRKLAALFGRAEARDFADVFVLAQRFGRAVLLARAAEVDLGFDRGVLAEMMRTIDRFADDELPITPEQVDAMRAFFRDWADELG